GRLRAGSGVLCGALFGLWTVELLEPAELLRLLSWWSLSVTSILLAPRQSYQKTSVTALRARLDGRELYTPLFDLRVLGVVELVALVLGVPLALQRFGAIGFFAALGAVVLLWLTMCTARLFGRRKPGKRWGWAFPFLSPFAAPRAAEALLEEALRDVAPAVVGNTLLPEDAFVGWMRPFVYDATNGREVEHRF